MEQATGGPSPGGGAAASDEIAGYRLIGPLGPDGDSRAYLAHAPGRLGLPGDPVCVKMIEGQHTRDQFRQVLDRLRVFSVADPEHLITLYEMGSVSRSGPATGRTHPGANTDYVWVSMTHQHVGSLVDPSVNLSRQALVHAVARAARGVHALHELGLAHGAIKPSNILFGTTGPVLADIELRSCLQPNLTLPAGTMLADIELTDPAVIRGMAPSRASDIWSLGATLHRVLTGLPLYPTSPDDDMLATLRRIGLTRPTLGENLTVQEATHIERCLAPDPAERPPTARALAEALEELL